MENKYKRRWLYTLLLILFFASAIVPLRVEALDVEAQLCRDNFFIAVTQLVIREFPNQAIGFSLMAFNEVRCEKSQELKYQISSEKENMANAIVTVKLKNVQHFALLHIHFDIDDSLISASPEWVSFTSEQQWKTEWCKLINVYPDERKEQNCPTE